ncbi:squalene--hopene cyclase [Virgibacillus sp. AGTR]|uniref:squalene--hopene cyclase n=1 Tax=unclassified Virgibacillus TaxID=2620237 RepID=UPI001966B9E1|nr:MULTISPECIES: squalene--hopene cyclase [unclassified Virgibacillus]MCC2248768.1 squalene--hopene cyclase [Virgibacillus sp. AGTR]MDY7045758.1 squalene--hopene cyclase [Virgibacillus sp. M23]QRZ17941.1 squalene--hopene cyclase [Virgibacillus sp. AGTR]
MDKQLEAAMNKLLDELKGTQNQDGSWTYPFETGITTDSYMIILLRTLEINDSNLIKSLAERIANKQQANGAWKLFYDEGPGNLTATVEAYYALLYSGYYTIDDKHIQKARHFIISNGGLNNIQLFAKIMLALTGQYSWPRHIPIPIEGILLPAYFPINLFDFSVYARAHFIPILLVADKKLQLTTSASPNLSDLTMQRKANWEEDLREWQTFFSILKGGIKKLIGLPHELHELALNRAETYILQRVEPDGTFNTYFSSTFLMIFALIARGYRKDHPVIKRAIKGLRSFIITVDNQLHMQFTTATVWNTSLISYSLQEAGVSSRSKTIQEATNYIRAKQQQFYGDWAIHTPYILPGGWGFSNVNTIVPDHDDTTAALRALRTSVLTKNTDRFIWDRGVEWILAMQNDDGGWGAFEKDVDSLLLTWLPIKGAELLLLDPSTADLTGRTLEFLATFTKLNQSHPLVKRAVHWLIKNQEQNGSWYGRWGICYIYGTWAAVTGLVAAGINPGNASIRRAVNWLYRIQHEDGGWGESCKSDQEKTYIPLKESTRTQTAWALDTLITAEVKKTNGIKRGMDFLLSNQEKQNNWTTNYPKGQALPGSFYMHYHSYEYLFPLLALAHYKKKFVEDDKS